jgi:hypothetical protein
LGDQPPGQVHRWRRTIETTEEDLINRVFPHPTISEAMHEAVRDAGDPSLTGKSGRPFRSRVTR